MHLELRKISENFRERKRERARARKRARARAREKEREGGERDMTSLVRALVTRNKSKMFTGKILMGKTNTKFLIYIF